MKSILLIGLGRFGRHVAEKLYELDHQVMAVDKQEDRVEAVMSYVTNAQIGDSTNMEFLETLGVSNFDVCIVAIASDFQSSLETTAYLKDLGAKMVVSRASRDVHARFLLRNGADEIRYSSEHIFDYVQLSDTHAIFEIEMPQNWVGKTIGQVDIRKKFNINIMALKRDGKLDMAIRPDTMLTDDATMLVLGESRDIQKCFKI